ncbi:MAG: beta-ribofuranosylaminobenzene 5'-phosphate synthase [Candidatus Helarchaeota archaeon]
MKIKIQTPCRLHFGLIDLNGKLGRIDGGLGVSLNYPNVILEIEKLNNGQENIIEGLDNFIYTNFNFIPPKNEIKITIQQILNNFDTSGIRIKIKDLIPSHVGLGSKTQLSLALGQGINKLFNYNYDVNGIAKIVKRGGTSGIGIRSFERGGFILDGGHSFGKNAQKSSFLPSSASNAPPAPCFVNHSLPEDWYFIIAIPNIEKGAHGQNEVNIFKEKCPIPLNQVEKISHLILMKILPAIFEESIELFGEGLTELQNLGFKKYEVNLQPKIIPDLMKKFLEFGAVGTGMSSFGPATYGLIKGKKQAENLMINIQNYLGERNSRVFYTNCNNSGATIKTID